MGLVHSGVRIMYGRVHGPYTGCKDSRVHGPQTRSCTWYTAVYTGHKHGCCTRPLFMARVHGRRRPAHGLYTMEAAKAEIDAKAEAKVIVTRTMSLTIRGRGPDHRSEAVAGLRCRESRADRAAVPPSVASDIDAGMWSLCCVRKSPSQNRTSS